MTNNDESANKESDFERDMYNCSNINQNEVLCFDWFVMKCNVLCAYRGFAFLHRYSLLFVLFIVNEIQMSYCKEYARTYVYQSVRWNRPISIYARNYDTVAVV